MRGPLPVGVSDPVERLRAVSVAMDKLKASKQPLGAEAIWGLNDWFRDFAPPVLLGRRRRSTFSTRLFNLLVTNFRARRSLLRARARAHRRLPDRFSRPPARLRSPSSATTAQVGFGLLSDPDALPDARQLVDHLAASVEELTAVAQIASPADDDDLAGDDRPGFARERERLGRD